MNKMLTREEIYGTYKSDRKLDKDLIDLATKNSEKRFEASLESKRAINQKVFILFNGFLTIALASISASFFVRNTVYKDTFYFFLPLSLLMMAALCCLIIAMKNRKHGAIGTMPSFWLKKENLGLDNESFLILRGYLLSGYEEKISKIYERNHSVSIWQNTALYLGFCGLLTGMIFFTAINLGYLQGIFHQVLAVVVVVVVLACYLLAKKY